MKRAGIQGSVVCLVLLAVVAITFSYNHQRVKRGGFTGHGGYAALSSSAIAYRYSTGAAGGYAYSSDLLIGAGVGGNLAYDSNQRNLFAINAGDLGSSFDVGASAHAIAKATRTSAAAGSKFKGGYGKRK